MFGAFCSVVSLLFSVIFDFVLILYWLGSYLIHIFLFDFQWPIRHAIVEDWDLMVCY